MFVAWLASAILRTTSMAGNAGPRPPSALVRGVRRMACEGISAARALRRINPQLAVCPALAYLSRVRANLLLSMRLSYPFHRRVSSRMAAPKRLIWGIIQHGALRAGGGGWRLKSRLRGLPIGRPRSPPARTTRTRRYPARRPSGCASLEPAQARFCGDRDHGGGFALALAGAGECLAQVFCNDHACCPLRARALRVPSH